MRTLIILLALTGSASASCPYSMSYEERSACTDAERAQAAQLQALKDIADAIRANHHSEPLLDGGHLLRDY